MLIRGLAAVVIAIAILVSGGTAGAQVPAGGIGPTIDSTRTVNDPVTGRAMPCQNGKILEFGCRNVELLAFLPPSAMGGEGLHDIWGWTDSTTGREFALVGGETGVAFVEITNPVHPVYLGKLPFHGGVTGEAGVKVYQRYALIVAEAAPNGMQVFDLTQLRDVKKPPIEFQETAHYDEITHTHTLAINPETGTAFANGSSTCGGGLHMIDVRTPTKPVFAGCYTETSVNNGWIHDTQCVRYHGPDKSYQGREICFSSSMTAVVIADVTDKKHPKTISTIAYPGAALVHQGWLTGDQRYFFLDDEFDEVMGQFTGIARATRTIVLDLNDLDDPVVLTDFYGTTNATDHNLYINGRYMYQSNYAAGLRIVDVADPAHPTEVGYFDTTPADGPGLILGSWGNYPFFKNGVVAVASNGLFLVRLSVR